MTKLRHPNVVRMYEVFETADHIYMVLELGQGGSLKAHLRSQKVLVETEAQTYFAQIVSALDYIHRQGILHRDLKLENILLDATQTRVIL
jgi:serine/threonine protein kinase